MEKARRWTLRIVLMVTPLITMPLHRVHAESKPVSKSRLTHEIVGIGARFFYEETGTVGNEDLLGDTVLWNTIIGEGDADAPSSTTLVLVRIEGDFATYSGPGTLQVQAHAGNHRLLLKRVPLKQFFTEKGAISVPFLVFDTGCAPLKVSATLWGVGPTSSKMQSTIPFQCGE